MNLSSIFGEPCTMLTLFVTGCQHWLKHPSISVLHDLIASNVCAIFFYHELCKWNQFCYVIGMVWLNSLQVYQIDRDSFDPKN